MIGSRTRGSLTVALAISLGVFSYPDRAIAQAPSSQELENKLRNLQEQVTELTGELQALKEQQQQQNQDVQKATVVANKATEAAGKEQTAFSSFMKGFFGTLDVSLDYTTKGMGGLEAFPWGYATRRAGQCLTSSRAR